MRVYYRGPDVLVTGQQMVWRPAEGRAAAFSIAELRSVRLVKRRLGWVRKQWEIHADVGGAEVVLYTSRDERVFNAVKRALRRAMEQAATDGRAG